MSKWLLFTQTNNASIAVLKRHVEEVTDWTREDGTTHRRVFLRRDDGSRTFIDAETSFDTLFKMLQHSEEA